MKMRFLSAFVLSALLFSCGSDDASYIDDGRVQFWSGATETLSKSDDDSWSDDEAIGIYMIGHDEELDESSIMENANNVRYSAQASSTSTTFSSSSPIYYPMDGSKVDFRAYCPHDSVIINNEFEYVLDLADQSNQRDVDLMVASANNEGNGYDKSNSSPVLLNFKHLLSKVIVKLEAGDGVGNIDDVDVKLSGMGHLIRLDLKDFSLSKVETTKSNNNIIPNDNGDNSYELVLPPSNIYTLDDCKMNFTIGSDTYTWKMINNTAGITDLESGTVYTFNIRVSKLGVDASGQISEWEDIFSSVVVD